MCLCKHDHYSIIIPWFKRYFNKKQCECCSWHPPWVEFIFNHGKRFSVFLGIIMSYFVSVIAVTTRSDNYFFQLIFFCQNQINQGYDWKSKALNMANFKFNFELLLTSFHPTASAPLWFIANKRSISYPSYKFHLDFR